MSSKPLIKRTPPPYRDTKGRAEYLVRLPLWKRYPRLFIVGGGCLCGSLVWIYPFYNALFLKPEDVPYQADWWPSEIARGKKTVDQMRERREKEALYRAEYERDKAAKEAAKAQLAKLKQ